MFFVLSYFLPLKRKFIREGTKYNLKNFRKEEIYSPLEIIHFSILTSDKKRIILLLEKEILSLKDECMELIAKEGNFHLLILLLEMGYKINFNVLIYLAKNNFFYIITYLYQEWGIKCDSKVSNIAARKRNFFLLNYLYKVQKIKCTPKAANYAAKKGHLDVLKYLYQEQNITCTQKRN